MIQLVWSIYSGGAVFALIFCILCFFTWREFGELENRLRDSEKQMNETSTAAGGGDDSTLSNPVENGTILVDVSSLASLFQGAAICGGVILISVIIFYAASATLLMCSCVSLAHPRKKFYRGLCSGGSFWLMFQTLQASLQFQSYANVVSSLSSRYDTNFNQELFTSCFSFGYMSAIVFLTQSIGFWFWREPVIRVEH